MLRAKEIQLPCHAVRKLPSGEVPKQGIGVAPLDDLVGPLQLLGVLRGHLFQATGPSTLRRVVEVRIDGRHIGAPSRIEQNGHHVLRLDAQSAVPQRCTENRGMDEVALDFKIRQDFHRLGLPRQDVIRSGIAVDDPRSRTICWRRGALECAHHIPVATHRLDSHTGAAEPPPVERLVERAAPSCTVQDTSAAGLAV